MPWPRLVDFSPGFLSNECPGEEALAAEPSAEPISADGASTSSRPDATASHAYRPEQHGSLARFVSGPDFRLMLAEIDAGIAMLADLVRHHDPMAEARVREQLTQWRARMGAVDDQGRSRRYGAGAALLYGEGKRLFDLFCQRAQDPALPLAQRLPALADLVDRIGTCGEGALLALTEITRPLASRRQGLLATAQRAFDELLTQQIAEWRVHHGHHPEFALPQEQGWEVHVVAGLREAVAARLDRPTHPDRAAHAPSPEALLALLGSLARTLRPSTLAVRLADQYLAAFGERLADRLRVDEAALRTGRPWDDRAIEAADTVQATLAHDYDTPPLDTLLWWKDTPAGRTGRLQPDHTLLMLHFQDQLASPTLGALTAPPASRVLHTRRERLCERPLRYLTVSLHRQDDWVWARDGGGRRTLRIKDILALHQDSEGRRLAVTERARLLGGAVRHATHAQLLRIGPELLSEPELAASFCEQRDDASLLAWLRHHRQRLQAMPAAAGALVNALVRHERLPLLDPAALDAWTAPGLHLLTPELFANALNGARDGTMAAVADLVRRVRGRSDQRASDACDAHIRSVCLSRTTHASGLCHAIARGHSASLRDYIGLLVDLRGAGTISDAQLREALSLRPTASSRRDSPPLLRAATPPTAITAWMDALVSHRRAHRLSEEDLLALLGCDSDSRHAPVAAALTLGPAHFRAIVSPWLALAREGPDCLSSAGLMRIFRPPVRTDGGTQVGDAGHLLASAAFQLQTAMDYLSAVTQAGLDGTLDPRQVAWLIDAVDADSRGLLRRMTQCPPDLPGAVAPLLGPLLSHLLACLCQLAVTGGRATPQLATLLSRASSPEPPGFLAPLYPAAARMALARGVAALVRVGGLAPELAADLLAGAGDDGHRALDDGYRLNHQFVLSDLLAGLHADAMQADTTEQRERCTALMLALFASHDTRASALQRCWDLRSVFTFAELARRLPGMLETLRLAGAEVERLMRVTATPRQLLSATADLMAPQYANMLDQLHADGRLSEVEVASLRRMGLDGAPAGLDAPLLST